MVYLSTRRGGGHEQTQPNMRLKLNWNERTQREALFGRRKSYGEEDRVERQRQMLFEKEESKHSGRKKRLEKVEIPKTVAMTSVESRGESLVIERFHADDRCDVEAPPPPPTEEMKKPLKALQSLKQELLERERPFRKTDSSSDQQERDESSLDKIPRQDATTQLKASNNTNDDEEDKSLDDRDKNIRRRALSPFRDATAYQRDIRNVDSMGSVSRKTAGSRYLSDNRQMAVVYRQFGPDTSVLKVESDEAVPALLSESHVIVKIQVSTVICAATDGGYHI